nr:NAC domain-containing protein [Tanacetum cinerariifolium]
NDSKPRSYDVTFSNSLFDLNDDYALCYDNPVIDDEFEDISSLDLLELIPVIDESTLLVTLPLPCTDVLGDAIVDIDLLLGENLDTLSMGDMEINFNPSRDIEELERLLADDPIPVPRVFD